MRKHPLPTPTRLRKLLRYEPDTGCLFWRERTTSDFRDGKRSKEWRCKLWNKKYAGKQAFSTNARGYIVGTVDEVGLRANRVAWAIHFGEWPENEVDHKNGDPSDNRLENLRDVSQVENLRNCRRRKDSTSGHTGVHWHKASGKWQAHGVSNGRRHHIGLFNDIEDAVAARGEFSVQNGYTNRHGKAEEFDLDG